MDNSSKDETDVAKKCKVRWKVRLVKQGRSSGASSLEQIGQIDIPNNVRDSHQHNMTWKRIVGMEWVLSKIF